MNSTETISQAGMKSANDSHGIDPGLTRTSYVFVFVPVYIEKKSDAIVGRITHSPLARLRHLFFRQDRHPQPFWTWFIDNPRPEPFR